MDISRIFQWKTHTNVLYEEFLFDMYIVYYELFGSRMNKRREWKHQQQFL